VVGCTAEGAIQSTVRAGTVTHPHKRRVRDVDTLRWTRRYQCMCDSCICTCTCTSTCVGAYICARVCLMCPYDRFWNGSEHDYCFRLYCSNICQFTCGEFISSACIQYILESHVHCIKYILYVTCIHIWSSVDSPYAWDERNRVRCYLSISCSHSWSYCALHSMSLLIDCVSF
jgi:hypothetical protein